MQTISIRAGDIETGERHRALSGDAVQRLAGSMKDIGLKSPISVRIADNVMIDGQPCDGVPMLVAGAHRLAAAKALGWSHIDCIEVEDDAITAELWELAENLHRLDLSKEQRDEHIRRYAELLTEREIQVAQVATPEIGYKKPPPQTKGIARQIADATGLSKDTVRRALNPQPIPVREPKSDHDVVLAQFNALMAAWNRAGPEARDMFSNEIDAPVFDNARAA